MAQDQTTTDDRIDRDELPDWAKEMSSLDGSTWYACETCGNNADEIADLDHKAGCPEADQDA